MTRLLRLFASLLLCSACSTFQVSDYQVFVKLPASGDCFGINVISKKETRIAQAQCDEIVKRALIFTSTTWRQIRQDMQNNCQFDQCKQLTGKFDALFLAIDQGLQKVPIIP